MFIHVQPIWWVSSFLWLKDWLLELGPCQGPELMVWCCTLSENFMSCLSYFTHILSLFLSQSPSSSSSSFLSLSLSSSLAACWVEWLYSCKDDHDASHRLPRPAGGRIRPGRGFPQLLPRLPDRRRHPCSAPWQRLAIGLKGQRSMGGGEGWSPGPGRCDLSMIGSLSLNGLQ